MRLILFLTSAVILNAATGADPYLTSNDYSESTCEEDGTVMVWKGLFTKLDTILGETDRLSQQILDFNKRFDNLEARFGIQDQKIDNLDKKQQVQTSLLNQLLESGHTEKDSFNDALDIKSLNQNREWTTILRRQDGSVNFYRNWTDYESGFGNPNGEFFIGLKTLHALTTYGAPQELLVILEDFENETRYAKYDLFKIGGSSEKYGLTDVGKYSGTAGDSLIRHVGMKFSTFDQDNGNNKDDNCSEKYHGAWWFFSCYNCHLTGPYRKQEDSNKAGVAWNAWKGLNSTVKFAEMMIRSKKC